MIKTRLAQRMLPGDVAVWDGHDAAIAVDGPAMIELSMPMDLRPHWRLLAQPLAILPGARRRQPALRA